MLRMLIVGYCYLCHPTQPPSVRRVVADQWFCKLDLDDKVPHHSTFPENRLNHFRESDIWRHIFERVVMTSS
jgi:hypothetical protein